jgi:hypothetical protein
MNKEKLKENCCTPEGQIKRYIDCKGCDRKPKQETFEEASHTAWLNYEHVEGNLYSTSFKNGFKFGANYQAERMYSEQEVLQLLLRLQQTESYDNLYDWFEQFKKK